MISKCCDRANKVIECKYCDKANEVMECKCGDNGLGKAKGVIENRYDRDMI